MNEVSVEFQQVVKYSGQNGGQVHLEEFKASVICGKINCDLKKTEAKTPPVSDVLGEFRK